MTRATYATEGAARTEEIFDGLYAETKGGVLLDSASGDGAIKSFLDSAEHLPPSIQHAIDRLDGREMSGEQVLDSVIKGMKLYYDKHGAMPTADVMEAALDQAANMAGDSKGMVKLDGVGSTGHHNQISYMPEQIQLGLLSAVAEAFPGATYLPTGIGSNEARLGIVSHQAASKVGGYDVGDLLDGTHIGDTFLSSERTVKLTLGTDRTTATGGITLDGASQVKLLRGRTQIYVNGFPVAEENPNANASATTLPLSGLAILTGTTYTISGTVTPDTGAVSLAFSPALPAGTVVHAEGYIDFEKQPTLAPRIATQVQTYTLYAKPWRGLLDQTIDSKTQAQNEIGMDLQSESLVAARNQITVERHRSILVKAVRLAAANTDEFDFDYAGQMQQKTRAQVWQDFSAILGKVSQKMAELTMDRGVTHLYIGKIIKAQWEALPSDLFEKSGLTEIPGIYRVGRLFGRYEVYYTPWEVLEDEAAGTAQVLCYGRSNSPARNSFVMGDAVPVTVLPTAFGQDMKFGQALYARNFTSVNPHMPSAMGCALITVKNMFKAANSSASTAAAA